MAGGTTTTTAPAERELLGPYTGTVIRNAHWFAGGAALLLAVVWLETGVGGGWSADSRQNLYMANILLLYMMVALGLNLISGYVGAASIGHIALFAIGAYTHAILTTEYGWPVWPAILMGACVATLASLPVGLILLRLSGWYFSVVTLLLVIVVADLILQQRDLTGGGAGIFGLTMPSLGSRQLDSRDYIYLVGGINVLVFLMLRHLLDRSRWGIAFVAVRQSEPAARAVGVHPFVVQESALAMSAFLAGLAGALFAPLPGLINPDSFPILDSIFFLLAILAGGMGTVAGPVVGTAILYIVPEWLNRQKALDDYSFLAYGVLLLAFVIFLPEGIVGGIRQLWYRFFGRRMRQPAIAEAAERRAISAGTRQAEAAGIVLGHLQGHGANANGLAKTPAMVASGISKRFGDNHALSDVSVSVTAGTIHAIIGPNGSGKTTLLNVISGFYPQDAGTVVIAGTNIRKGRAAGSIRHGVARTFQTPQVLPALSGLDNVMLGAHAQARASIVESLLPLPNVRRERREAEAIARAALDLVGLDPAAVTMPCAAMPFPHRRLLEMARALAGRPALILLDEPASGLHPGEVREFAALLRVLREHGLTIVLVEHNFELVGELADCVTVLDAGRLLAEGNVAEVRANPAVVEAYLGV